jgi:hypothetical protein
LHDVCFDIYFHRTSAVQHQLPLRDAWFATSRAGMCT